MCECKGSACELEAEKNKSGSETETCTDIVMMITQHVLQRGKSAACRLEQSALP